MVTKPIADFTAMRTGWQAAFEALQNSQQSRHSLSHIKLKKEFCAKWSVRYVPNGYYCRIINCITVALSE